MKKVICLLLFVFGLYFGGKFWSVDNSFLYANHSKRNNLPIVAWRGSSLFTNNIKERHLRIRMNSSRSLKTFLRKSEIDSTKNDSMIKSGCIFRFKARKYLFRTSIQSQTSNLKQSVHWILTTEITIYRRFTKIKKSALALETIIQMLEKTIYIY